MLWRGRALGSRLLAIAFIEAIDAPSGVDQLLFPGKERVASRADFDVEVTFAGLERFAARAGNGYINVFGVNSWFHLTSVTLYRRPQAAFSNMP
jgi:hypothetical protein